MKNQGRWEIDQLYRLLKRAQKENDPDTEHAVIWAIYQLTMPDPNDENNKT